MPSSSSSQNDNTGYFKSGISVYGKEPSFNQTSEEEDDEANYPDPTEEKNPIALIATLLGKALKRLPAYEPLMQSSAQEEDPEAEASPKRFQNYLQDYLVTESSWKASKPEKVALAHHVVQQALPQALYRFTV
jgi:hypothetical protein